MAQNSEKLFKCPQCLKKFNLEDELLMHLITYNDEELFKCQFCGKQFDNQSELSIHRRIHSIENIAALIKARTAENALYRSSELTNRTSFDCQFCQKTFTHQSDATKHVRAIHFITKPFKCSLCEYSFADNNEAASHKKNFHLDDKQFKCLLCEKYFAREVYLEKHLKRHSTTSIVIKNMDSDANLQDHKPNLTGKSADSQAPVIQANHSPQSNGTNGTQKLIKSSKAQAKPLNRKSHISEKGIRFECQLCEKTFGRKRDAVRHEQVIHFGKKRFKCSFCEKRFTDKHQVRLHEKGYHLRDKQMKCQLCDKFFLRKIEIERHLRTHTGLKPYKCKTCDKSFAYKKNLLAHEALHRKEPVNN